MGGEGIQGDIGYHTQFRQRVFQCAYRALHQAVFVECLLGQQALACSGDNRKQRDCRNAQLLDEFGLRHQQVDTESFYPRHGGDSLALAAALEHENGKNKVGRIQCIFAYQSARKFIGPQAAHAGVGEHAALCGECHRNILDQRRAKAVLAVAMVWAMSPSPWALDIKPAS